jgi:hypothetical protein
MACGLAQTLEPTMRHLRALSPLLLFFISNLAFGGGYGGAEGTNRLGQKVGFTSEDLHQIWVRDPKQGKGNFKTYEMSSECPAIIEWLDAEPTKGLLIRCSTTGLSPLAGTTYTKIKSKRIKNFCNEPAIVFKCVAGCERKEVPHIIVEQPWEC